MCSRVSGFIAGTDWVHGQSSLCNLFLNTLCPVTICVLPRATELSVRNRPPKESLPGSAYKIQVPPSLPCFHHPIFHQHSRVISAIGPFVIFHTDVIICVMYCVSMNYRILNPKQTSGKKVYVSMSLGDRCNHFCHASTSLSSTGYRVISAIGTFIIFHIDVNTCVM